MSHPYAKGGSPKKFDNFLINFKLDIRDTVKYKEVMSQYGLGPNGAIVTSLNLFATRTDQIISFIDKQPPSIKWVDNDGTQS